MNTLNHLKGNFILSGVGIGGAIFSKHFLKKETMPVSSAKQIFFSYIYLTSTSIVAKLIMDKLIEMHWLHFYVKGKVVNEGFIGPLSADQDFIGPPHGG